MYIYTTDAGRDGLLFSFKILKNRVTYKLSYLGMTFLVQIFILYCNKLTNNEKIDIHTTSSIINPKPNSLINPSFSKFIRKSLHETLFIVKT